MIDLSYGLSRGWPVVVGQPYSDLSAPVGYILLVDSDGAYLTDADGFYLVEAL